MAHRLAVTFAESAVQDLEEIRLWYTEQMVPEVGEDLVKELLSQIQRLLRFPMSGRVVPEFGVAHLREIIHPPYRVVYRVESDRIRIIRIWRSERLLKIPS